MLLQLLIGKKSLFLSRIMGWHPVWAGETPQKRGFITPQTPPKGD